MTTTISPTAGSDRISSLDLAGSLATVADLAHPALAEHHRLTAYIAERIGREMGLDDASVDSLVLASTLHDIGALTLGERLAALELDFENEEHAVPGALLLVDYRPFADAAEIVRYHHQRWHDGQGVVGVDGQMVPVESHVLFLADRIAIVAAGSGDALERRDRALDAVESRVGDFFWPDAVEAFRRVASEEAMWFDIDAIRHGRDAGIETEPGRDGAFGQSVSFDLDDIELFARSMSRVIDFKSRFTATHSAGVASVAEALGALTGSDERGRRRLRIGGLLHDVGKLSVSSEILEKPEPLSPQERHIIESHPYFSYRVLQGIVDYEDLTFAALHHEQLSGSGYPFRLTAEDIGWEARLMAVADVYTALAEDRPYREGLSGTKSTSIMDEMVDRGQLDPEANAALFGALHEVDLVRQEAQDEAYEDFESFMGLCAAASNESWETPVSME